MKGKSKTSHRQSSYLPGIRRSPDAPPIVDALSAPTVQLLSTILEKSAPPEAHILAAIDEISDVVARYRDAKNNKGEFPTIERQRQSLRLCDVSFRLLEDCFAGGDELRVPPDGGLKRSAKGVHATAAGNASS